MTASGICIASALYTAAGLCRLYARRDSTRVAVPIASTDEHAEGRTERVMPRIRTSVTIHCHHPRPYPPGTRRTPLHRARTSELSTFPTAELVWGVLTAMARGLLGFSRCRREPILSLQLQVAGESGPLGISRGTNVPPHSQTLILRQYHCQGQYYRSRLLLPVPVQLGCGRILLPAQPYGILLLQDWSRIGRDFQVAISNGRS